MGRLPAPRRLPGRGPMRRARGQALLEFALVIPTFFILVMAIFQLGAWAYDTQALGHGVRIGAEAGNQAMSPLNLRFSTDPRLSTAWLPNGATNSVFASLPSSNRACRTAANDFSKANVVSRLGWDWGCVYDPASGKEAGVPVNARDAGAAIYAPLQAAITRARTAIGEVYLGQVNGMTITACYAVLNAAGSPVCVLTLSQASDSSGTPGPYTKVGALPNARTTAGPSFMIVTVSAAAIRLGGGPIITLDASTMVVLNRFVPPCSAPVNPADVKPGTCGAIF